MDYYAANAGREGLPSAASVLAACLVVVLAIAALGWTLARLP